MGKTRTRASLSTDRSMRRRIALLGFLFAVCVSIEGWSYCRTHDAQKRYVDEQSARRSKGIARSLAHELDAGAWMADAARLTERDAIEDWKDAPSSIVSAREALLRAVDSHRIETPVYTMHLRPEMAEMVRADPDRRWPDALQFVLNSAHDTNWRHPYDYLPKMKPVLIDGRPYATNEYADEWGTWVSGWAPLRDAEGQVVGMVAADERLDFRVARLREQTFGFGVTAAMSALAFLAVLTWVLRWLIVAERTARLAARNEAEFLARSNHELRTPLIGVLGMTEALKNSELSEAQKEDLEVLERSASHLEQIVEELVRHGERDDDQAAPEPVEVRPYLEDLMARFRPGIAERALEIRSRFAEGVPETIVTDPRLLADLLSALIDNAIAFTRSGFILFEVRCDGRCMTIAVADSGTGIEAERQDRVFLPFVRFAEDQRLVPGGPGLGLTRARRLAGTLGGTLELAPGSEQGTRVTLTIATRLPGKAQEAPSASACNEERTGHVLLVEDNAINAKVARMTLERCGHSVVHAVDGIEGCAAFELESFDLVLMDLAMPRRNGYEAAAWIRAFEHREGRGRVPIIALTADGAAASRSRAHAAGMDAWKSKPYAGEELLALLQTWLPADAAARCATTEDRAPAYPVL